MFVECGSILDATDMAHCKEHSFMDISLILGHCEHGAINHAFLLHRKMQEDNFAGASLVCMYAKCGSLEDSRETFQRLPDGDVVSWSTLIAGYVDSADGEEALNCFADMKLQGVSPDSVTYSSSLKA